MIDYSQYYGQWVAETDAGVVAHRATLVETLDELKRLGTGATIVFVEHPELVRRWGVTYPPDLRFCPNCLFMEREQAERWGRSWDKPAAVLWYREHDGSPHGSWREIGPVL